MCFAKPKVSSLIIEVLVVNILAQSNEFQTPMISVSYIHLLGSSMCGQSIGKPDSNASSSTFFVVESTVMNLKGKGVNFIMDTLFLDPFRKVFKYTTPKIACLGPDLK
jgi:hypothetical protein